MKFYILTCVILLFSVIGCKNETKSGFVEVPTVTSNALSGIYDLSPKYAFTKLHYEEVGQGEPVILLHAHSLDLRMWDDVISDLAKNYRVIRYDLRGYGQSGMPEVGFGFLHADDLCNLMDSLHIQKAHLAGLSLGGMTVADFVALYPDRVLSATISSGALSGSPDRRAATKSILKIYNDTVFQIRRQEIKKNLKKGVPELKKEWKAGMKFISGKHYRGIKKDLNRMIDDWQAWQLTHPEIDALIGAQADSLLVRQKKQPPILFLIGQYDSKGSKRSMQRMAALCKNSKIKILSEAGHLTVMESPREFLREMEAFMASK